MKRFTLIFLSLILYVNCTAQLINTKPKDISLGPISFNPAAVKQNKIKSLLVVVVDKPDGEVIIDKGNTQGYEFDTCGNVTRYYYTVFNTRHFEDVDVPAVYRHGKLIRPAGTRTVAKYINDTIFVNVFYDKQNHVIAKRMQAGDYYDAYYYEYDSVGRIRKEMHSKETNASENKKELQV